MSTPLIELLTEGLPSKVLTRLGEAFACSLFDGLSAQGLLEEGAVVEGSTASRRLATSITGTRRIIPDRELYERVLSVTTTSGVGGKPAAPLAKKLAASAKTAGMEAIVTEPLERGLDGKVEALFYRYTIRDAMLADGLRAALPQAIANLPIPKVMMYQRLNGENVQFVHPAHKPITLLDSGVIPVSVFGLQSSNVTLNHRFLSVDEIVIQDAASYTSMLESRDRVIAGYGKRKEAIRVEPLKTAGADTVVMPEALLDEVNAPVEWPMAHPCHFGETSLAIPQECLVLTIQTNQECFALADAQGHLHNRSLTVSNIATDTLEAIVRGNERVIHPRLAGARFFFEQDGKRPLADHVPLLSRAAYHNEIGTQLERASRLQAIVGQLVGKPGVDVARTPHGTPLAKTDLLTDVVGEFPRLQGTMGTYYARHDGEPDDVALTCSERYQPHFVGDVLPSTVAGTVVALADKPGALVDIQGIGLQPTGREDPSMLHRHALGTLRVLIERPLALTIDNTLQIAAASFDSVAAVKPDLAAITDFLYDRLRGYLKDKGHSTNEVEAVASQCPQRLDDIVVRLEAARAFTALSRAEALVVANKRIINILEKTDVAIGIVQPPLLKKDVECALHQSMVSAELQVYDTFACGDFTTAFKTLAGLREAVGTSSGGVMVMADDTALRDNRLALLAGLHGLMSRVADIFKLAT